MRRPFPPPARSSSKTVPLAPRRVALSLFALALAGCGGGAPAGPAGHVQTYAVEGEVLYLPTDSTPALTIRHQAIDGFVDMDGEVVGMEAMTMPFPIGEGVSLEGIDKGDAVRFTLEVEWDGDPPYRISRIEEIAAAGD